MHIIILRNLYFSLDTINRQIKLIKSWEQEIKEATSFLDGYVARVEKYIQLRERIDSWYDPLSNSEIDTMKRLHEQIGGDVNIEASDIRYKLKDLTEEWMEYLHNYISQLKEALKSGNIDEMKKNQIDMPVSIVDDLLKYHLDNWNDKAYVGSANDGNNQRQNERGLVSYQRQYQQDLINYLLSMGYNALRCLIA